MTGWQQAAFEDVLEDVSRGQPKTLARDFEARGELPLVDQGKELIGGYTDNLERRCTISDPLIVFGDHTRELKYIDFAFGVGADGVKLLRSRRGDDLRYLFWALRAADIPAAGYSRHYKFLKALTIPLPPIEEQRRIAAILDAADEVRAKRRESLALADSLTEAIFLDMFGDLGAASPSATLRELGKVTTGKTPPSSRDGMFGGSIPFVTPGDLESGKQVQRSLTENGAVASKVVAAGSTLVCCIGATIGKVGGAHTTVAFNQQINAIEWGERVVPDFGHAALRTLRPVIRARGASTTLPLLKKSAFEQLVIPVPPLALQKRYAVTAQEARGLSASLAAPLHHLDELFASLQQRAFRGEL